MSIRHALSAKASAEGALPQRLSLHCASFALTSTVSYLHPPSLAPSFIRSAPAPHALCTSSGRP
jgi:hypothetical protein